MTSNEYKNGCHFLSNMIGRRLDNLNATIDFYILNIPFPKIIVSIFEFCLFIPNSVNSILYHVFYHLKCLTSNLLFINHFQWLTYPNAKEIRDYISYHAYEQCAMQCIHSYITDKRIGNCLIQLIYINQCDPIAHPKHIHKSIVHSSLHI